MRMRRSINVLLLLLSLFSCREKDRHGRLVDTPTTGTITIAVDESLKPLIEAEVAAFEGLYKEAHIRPLYVSEDSAFRLLVTDSARLAVVTRRLSREEKDRIFERKIVATEVRVGRGAVALITNKNSPDSTMNLSDLESILHGESNMWSDLQPSYARQPLEIIFDNPHSGIARFLRDSLLHGAAFPSNCFAVNGNEAVIDYIVKKPYSIGLIGVEWISDRDDSTANRFLSTVRVIRLNGHSGLVKPYQAYLATGDYPLIRDTFIASGEARTGLGSGFIAFVSSDKGQRIVLKAGLVPATMPVRLVEFTPSSPR